MENTNTTIVTLNDETPSEKALQQVEDTALKLTAQYFSDSLLPYLNIDGEVDHIAPTETIHLELKKFYQDFNFVMKDGSWKHFEFQSTNKGISDLKRFRCYEALISYQHNVDVRTYVLYSGTIKNPVTEFTSGFNTYRVHPIIMKGHRTEIVFDNITKKLEHSIPLTQEDLVPLTLCPLMGGDMPQKERIRNAFRIIRESENSIPDVEKIEAVIYAMASKFLDSEDFKQIKEEIKMTELGLFIYNDGKADGISQGISQGIEQNALENAKNFFLNGATFELVRKSIHTLSDDVLRKIYDEVNAGKITD